MPSHGFAPASEHARLYPHATPTPVPSWGCEECGKDLPDDVPASQVRHPGACARAFEARRSADRRAARRAS